MEDRTDDATPQTAAITGGVPLAAEPPPQTRGRAGTIAASSWLYIVLGLLLLIAAVAFDQESAPAIGTALAGAALIATGVLGLTGFAGPVAVALLAFAGGVLMTIAAFSADDFGFPQLLLLVAGAATFISSFAGLAAARRPGRGGEEPQPGVEQV